MSEDWDADIAATTLSDAEKNGLQIYRNYNKSFNDAREKQFSAGIDQTPLDLTSLREVLLLIAKDDIRFVPVIACAFADQEARGNVQEVRS